MSETNGPIPVNNPDNSIRSPQAAPPIRFDPLHEVDAFDIPPPSSPPPPYSAAPPLDIPAPPPYILCTCSSHENPTTLVDIGFHSALAHEIWNKWQQYKRQHPEVYQNLNPQSLLYCFLSFAFQATQLPFAFPGYDPRHFHAEMCVYLLRWGIPCNVYYTREWNEEQRIARCADAAAQWMVSNLSEGCLGHSPLRDVWTDLDDRRFHDLWWMARAARSVL
ncbi:uncharacterized protein Bfra_003529 [Botrytis fragariae]|uniref:Uncharacterized protein n=1 Tax=Botrytis fragariae TaxID=1964551 RepID=A0A8H6AX24_9HELO|nr:uncharacterized protein Bfra_003529 [Botrytis fragariae]KAF5875075.1 hypothetical protein Bfra_003529 [Botrytis fragariae]